jgi:hypothetical protein
LAGEQKRCCHWISDAVMTQVDPTSCGT